MTTKVVAPAKVSRARVVWRAPKPKNRSRYVMRAIFSHASAGLLAAFLQLLGLAALLAVHRLRNRAFLAGGLEPGPALGRAQARQGRLRALRVVLHAAALELRDRAREVGVLALQVR